MANPWDRRSGAQSHEDRRVVRWSWEGERIFGGAVESLARSAASDTGIYRFEDHDGSLGRSPRSVQVEVVRRFTEFPPSRPQGLAFGTQRGSSAHHSRAVLQLDARHHAPVSLLTTPAGRRACLAADAPLNRREAPRGACAGGGEGATTAATPDMPSAAASRGPTWGARASWRGTWTVSSAAARAAQPPVPVVGGGDQGRAAVPPAIGPFACRSEPPERSPPQSSRPDTIAPHRVTLQPPTG